MTEFNHVTRANVEPTETQSADAETQVADKQAAANSDSRWAQRRRYRLPALVKLHGRGEIPCMVLDISSTGLSLELMDGSSANSLPDSVTVYIPTENVCYDSAVIRRDGGQAGVKFTAPPRMVAKQTRRMVKQAPQKKSALASFFGK